MKFEITEEKKAQPAPPFFIKRPSIGRYAFVNNKGTVSYLDNGNQDVNTWQDWGGENRLNWHIVDYPFTITPK